MAKKRKAAGRKPAQRKTGARKTAARKTTARKTAARKQPRGKSRSARKTGGRKLPARTAQPGAEAMLSPEESAGTQVALDTLICRALPPAPTPEDLFFAAINDFVKAAHPGVTPPAEAQGRRIAVRITRVD
jgi:hypothetical protein